MEFEFKHALHDLDQPTPPFLVQEIFSHGSLESRRLAIEVLTGMDPETTKTVRILKEILKIS